jgi:hypothetical protein
VFVTAFTVSAQQQKPTPQTDPNGNKQAATAQSPEMKQAREQLQHDIEEGKRLQQQLQVDKHAKDRDAVKRDNEALKANRDRVKQDQQNIQQITKGRGRGERGGDGRGGDGRGTGGGRGRGRI